MMEMEYITSWCWSNGIYIKMAISMDTVNEDIVEDENYYFA